MYVDLNGAGLLPSIPRFVFRQLETDGRGLGIVLSAKPTSSLIPRPLPDFISQSGLGMKLAHFCKKKKLPFFVGLVHMTKRASYACTLLS